MAISVVVPIYNVDEYLLVCLKSILSQAFTEFVIYLIDDGSVDCSGILSDQTIAYDDRIVVVHKKNGGLSDARNCGIELTLLEDQLSYITFIDSDDAIKKNYLSILINESQNKNADVTICDYESLRSIEDEYNEELCGYSSHIYSGIESILCIYKEKSVPIMAWGKLFKTELFHSDIRFPFGKINEDEKAIPLLLSKAGTVVMCQCKLYLYRLRENSIMQTKFNIQRYDAIEIYDENIEYFKSIGESEVAKAISEIREKSLALFALLARKHKFYQNVPVKYRISVPAAFLYLKKNCKKNELEYYMGLICPKTIILTEYLKKIRALVIRK